MQKNKSFNFLKGYRLHKERVIFSGGEIIRTIKLPLEPLVKTQESEELKKEIEQAIIKDDLHIRGNINLNDYLSAFKEKKFYYTLFDFWLDSIKAGVIFQPTNDLLIDFVSEVMNINSPYDEMWEEAKRAEKKKIEYESENLDPLKFFDKNKFKKIILSDPKRKSSKRSAFQRQLRECLNDQYKNNHKKTNNDKQEDTESSDAKKTINLIIDFILNSFFENEESKLNDKEQEKSLKINDEKQEKSLKLNAKEQEEFWKDYFGFDKKKLEERKPTNELKDITFSILPDLISDQVISDNPTSSKKDPLDDLIEIIEKIKKILEEKKFKVDEKLQEVLGLSNNFNAFSNYFGLVIKKLQKEKEKEDVIEALKKINPKLEEDKNSQKLSQAIDYLSKKAELLKKPSFPLVKSWAEYRSVVGGKIQSWFTNYQKRRKELNNQIEEFKSNLEKIKNHLENLQINENDDFKKERDEILYFCNKLLDKKNNINIESSSNYEIFNSILSHIKRKLNLFYQKYLQEKDEEKINNSNFESYLKTLYKRIYKPVNFFGETKKEYNKKIIYHTIPILTNGINLIKEILCFLENNFDPKTTFIENKRKDEKEEDIIRKNLNFFWSKITNKAVNSIEFKNKYKDILKNELQDENQINKILKNPSRYTFYKSPYAKGNAHVLEIKNNNSLDHFKELVINCLKFLEEEENSLSKKNYHPLIILDWIELAKHIMALLLRFNTNKEFDLPNINSKIFPQVKNYLEFFSSEKENNSENKKINKNDFSFIIQSFIFSEIKAAATFYSKKTYLARYTVQIINSNDKFLLLMSPKDKNSYEDKLKEIIQNEPLSKERKNLINQPHYYLVYFNPKSIKNGKKDEVFINLQKNNLKIINLSSSSQDGLFKISSSFYQIQFLEKFIAKPKKWEDVNIKLNEWSFIFEREYQVNWDWHSEEKIKLSLLENSRKNKLYVAIPFTISVKKEKEDALSQISKNRLNYPLLGVDVGEYGLGWCLIKIDNQKINLLGKGFIEDKNIGKIKDKFAQIQQKAKMGAFDESSSVIAQVRENAVGALRNKIHHLLTKNQSSVIYEASISNFETGSGKTTKIYNTIKRADLYAETKADESDKKHIWGINQFSKIKMLGKELSAYASSYICSNCQRSLYQIKKEDLEQIKVEKRDGNIITLSTNLGFINAYSKDKKYKEGYCFKNTEESLKEFIKIVKDFARPPINKESEVINKFVKNKINEDKLENFSKKRGNSALFICPFVDCHHIADADIQAAFMMAIRGYLNFSKVKEEKEINYLKKTIDFLNNLKEKVIIDLEV